MKRRGNGNANTSYENIHLNRKFPGLQGGVVSAFTDIV
jgi:hypothetical protein